MPAKRKSMSDKMPACRSMPRHEWLHLCATALSMNGLLTERERVRVHARLVKACLKEIEQKAGA